MFDSEMAGPQVAFSLAELTRWRWRERERERCLILVENVFWYCETRTIHTCTHTDIDIANINTIHA